LHDFSCTKGPTEARVQELMLHPPKSINQKMCSLFSWQHAISCLLIFEIFFCRFSQSGNLNRHMRVHGTNGALITWQRHFNAALPSSSFVSDHYDHHQYASVTCCSDEYQRVKYDEQQHHIYKNKYLLENHINQIMFW
jgi:hypothetical protein